MKVKVLFLLLFTAFLLKAQNRAIDSISGVIKNSKEDTLKAGSIMELAWQYYMISDFDKSLEYNNEALKLSEKLNWNKGIANVNNNVAGVYQSKGQFADALECYLKALTIYQKLKFKKSTARALGNIGSMYKMQGNSKTALLYYFKSMKLAEETNYLAMQAAVLNNIAIIYNEQGDHEKEMECFKKALAISEKGNSKEAIANTLGNIGLVYEILGEKEKGDKANKYFDEANTYFMKSLKIYFEIGEKKGVVRNYINLGELYVDLKKPAEGEKYFMKAFSLADSIGYTEMKRNSAQILEKFYEKNNNAEKALKYYKIYVATNDSIFNEENTKKMVRAEMNFAFQKKEAETKLQQEKKEAIAAAESKKQSIILWSVCGILILVIGFAVFAYRSYLQKQKANVEITKQKHIIEEKQKEILDSIRYARKIQHALITSEKYIDKSLNKLQK